MAAAPSSVRRRFLLTIRCTSSGCSEANADRLPSRWCVAMAKATACSSLFSVSQFVVCNVCMMCLCAYADCAPRTPLGFGLQGFRLEAQTQTLQPRRA